MITVITKNIWKLYAKIDTNNDFWPNLRILLSEIFKPIPAIAITSNIFDVFWRKVITVSGIKFNEVRIERIIKHGIK